jgi:hypothetical protein
VCAHAVFVGIQDLVMRCETRFHVIGIQESHFSRLLKTFRAWELVKWL